jgi:hypothetical protein
MRYFYIIFCFVCISVVSILGFRGSKFTKTPLYIFPDMDWQAKFQTQGENNFFADERDERPVVPGTVLRGYGWSIDEVFSGDLTYAPAEDPGLFSGKDDKGEFLKDFPIEVNHELMELGQKKYDTFCYLCHGKSGDGNGITKQYGMIATVSYHDDRIRTMAVGEIFDTITNGKNQMGAYGSKLSPSERWAIIAYVRALQLAQNAKVEDVPVEFRSKLGL